MGILVSNPPFNVKWKHTGMEHWEKRFQNVGVIPPESNANYLFILSALDISDRAIFILPNGVLTTTTKEELEIRKQLVEKNWIESVISLPGKMFESTDIPVCIIVFNKNKSTTNIQMIDASLVAEEEERLQNGQFGGSSHTNRTYSKKVNILSHEAIQKIVVKSEEITRTVTLEEIRESEYNLSPKRYFEIKIDLKFREYEDIMADINRIRKSKNCCKLTINEKIARELGLDCFKKTDVDFGDLEKLIGCKFIKEDFISYSKNKNEIKFSNNSDEEISHILQLIIPQFKAMIFYLNNEENKYLAELRDKVLYELMNGILEVENDEPSTEI